MKLRAAVAGMALLALAGCASAAATDPTAVGVSSMESITAATSTAPTVDQASVDVCRSLVNELDRTGLTDLMVAVFETDSFTPIAFSSAITDYRPVSADAADEVLGSAVNRFNRAVKNMADTAFTLWGQEHIDALVKQYADVSTACMLFDVDIPMS